jgi:hypothetical protein
MRTTHTFLITLSLALLLGSAYLYFSHGLDVKAATSSGLESSSGTSSPEEGTVDAKIAEDTAFLATLTSLTKITIDTSIFKDKSFNLLTDHTVVLEQAVPGRPNPFASINGVTVTDAPADLVITNDPSQVTNKTAVLNGTVLASAGVTSVYFEYGTTDALGKATVPVKQSLIGSFVTNVTGLTSGTQYFYRSVAKINNATVYGGIISFTTK